MSDWLVICRRVSAWLNFPRDSIWYFTTNDTTSPTITSVTSSLGKLMSTTTKIIFSSVNNNGTTIWHDCVRMLCLVYYASWKNIPNDRVGTNQLDLVVSDLQGTLAISRSNNVAQVTNMAFFIFRSTMSLAERVEVSTSRSTAYKKRNIWVSRS